MKPYKTCFPPDAEPKYLVAVQPIPVNDVKKHCTGNRTDTSTSCLLEATRGVATGSLTLSSPARTGKVNLEKPLHLVIGSVSPTAVLLSWGNSLKTPYDGNILDECLEDG